MKAREGMNLAVRKVRDVNALEKVCEGHVWAPVDHRSPLVALMEAEEQALASSPLDVQGCRDEVLVKLLHWLAEDGIHPQAVCRRLYGLGGHQGLRPWCEEGAVLMLEEGTAGARYRLRRIRAGYLANRDGEGPEARAREFSRAELEVAEGEIEASLGRFYQRCRWTTREHGRTPLAELLCAGASAGEANDLEEWACGRETLARVLEWLCEDGQHPGAVLRRVYAIGKALARAPWCLLTLDEMGMLFGEERATVSFRINRIFTGYLKRHGARGFKARFQREEGARESSRQAALGNKNRANSVRRRRGAAAPVAVASRQLSALEDGAAGAAERRAA